MTLRKMTLVPVLALALSPLASCSGGGAGGVISGAASTPLYSFPAESQSNLRVSLTDAPSKDLKSVFVNIDHAELLVNKGGAKGRLIVAQDLGMVDLLTLKNGVLLPMQDLTLGAGTEITGIRLVLKGDNNHSIKSDDSRCEMQTPSGQQSGIKIHLAKPFTIQSGSVYSMVMDFDAEKSVVVKGNGDCLLKPVLKLLSVTRVVVDTCAAAAKSDDNSSDDNSSDDNSNDENSNDDSSSDDDSIDDNSSDDSSSDNSAGCSPPAPVPGTEPTPAPGTEPAPAPAPSPEPAPAPIVIPDDYPIQIIPVTDGTDANMTDGGTPAPGTGSGGFEIPMDPITEPPVLN